MGGNLPSVLHRCSTSQGLEARAKFCQSSVARVPRPMRSALAAGGTASGAVCTDFHSTGVDGRRLGGPASFGSLAESPIRPTQPPRAKLALFALVDRMLAGDRRCGILCSGRVSRREGVRRAGRGGSEGSARARVASWPIGDLGGVRI